MEECIFFTFRVTLITGLIFSLLSSRVDVATENIYDLSLSEVLQILISAVFETESSPELLTSSRLFSLSNKISISLSNLTISTTASSSLSRYRCFNSLPHSRSSMSSSVNASHNSLQAFPESTSEAADSGRRPFRLAKRLYERMIFNRSLSALKA